MYFPLIKTFMLCSEVLWMPHLYSKSPKVLVWLGGICIGVSCLTILLEMLKVADCGCPVCLFFFFKKIFKTITLFKFYLWFLFVFLCGETELREIVVQKKRKQLYGPVLFVAKRMLKWQICKFVSEESLVFIFISQSGFLLAEQQARKRPILTT